jgi:capsular polysaccharide biosynthesis protein
VQEINLYQLLKFYATKWFWILMFIIVGAGAGFVYNTYIQVPLYKSDATLLIIDDTGKAAKDPTLINNYIELIKSRRVLDAVVQKHPNTLTYEELTAATTATNEKDTEVIKVSVATKDAQISKDMAGDIVTSFQGEAKEIYEKDNVTVVDQANLPTEPYNVHHVMYLALATGAGFAFALIVLFFAYDFKQTRQTLQKERVGDEEKAKVTPESAKEEVKVQPTASTWQQTELPETDPIEAAFGPDENEDTTESDEQSKNPDEQKSLARRTMRKVASLTLHVPERSNSKKDD